MMDYVSNKMEQLQEKKGQIMHPFCLHMTCF